MAIDFGYDAEADALEAIDEMLMANHGVTFTLTNGEIQCAVIGDFSAFGRDEDITEAIRKCFEQFKGE